MGLFPGKIKVKKKKKKDTEKNLFTVTVIVQKFFSFLVFFMKLTLLFSDK